MLFPHWQRVFGSQGTFSARHRWLLRHILSTASPRACLVMPLLNSCGRSTAWSNKWVMSACMQPGLTTRSHWNCASPVACRQSVTIPLKFIYQDWQQPHHMHYDQCCKKCFGRLRLGWALILLLSCTSITQHSLLWGVSRTELKTRPLTSRWTVTLLFDRDTFIVLGECNQASRAWMAVCSYFSRLSEQ